MRKIFVFCRIKLKFCFWLYKKRWHTSWKFQLEITSNKKSYRQNAFDKLIWNEQYSIDVDNWTWRTIGYRTPWWTTCPLPEHNAALYCYNKGRLCRIRFNCFKSFTAQVDYKCATENSAVQAQTPPWKGGIWAWTSLFSSGYSCQSDLIFLFFLRKFL